jgi:hypothetical protein
MRPARPWPLAAALVACALALAAPVLAASPAPAVRLLSPAPGAALVAGGAAELAWEPVPSFAGLPAVEEWEAFLSFDGGATYPLRLTPHLDQDVRRISWRVPSIATGDARILLRFGDERRETAVALPEPFVIEARAVPLPLGDGSLSLARRAARAAGEPALPGHRGVAAWVEGTRRGGAARQVVGTGWSSLEPTAAAQPSPRTELLPGDDPPDGGDALAQRRVAPAAERRASRGRSSGPPPPRPCPDLLLQTQRQNE